MVWRMTCDAHRCRFTSCQSPIWWVICVPTAVSYAWWWHNDAEFTQSSGTHRALPHNTIFLVNIQQLYYYFSTHSLPSVALDTRVITWASMRRLTSVIIWFLFQHVMWHNCSSFKLLLVRSKGKAHARLRDCCMGIKCNNVTWGSLYSIVRSEFIL